jgi:molybdopterin synthase catalytic subunit
MAEGVRVAALHRMGSLRIGEIAVVCSASAPHRAEAFEAARALIEGIKARVPIWKREHGPDGASWVGWIDARCASHDHAEDDPPGQAIPPRPEE